MRGLNLSSVIRQGLSGGYFECDSLVLKAFCKSAKIDFLWMFEISKAYCSAINRNLGE
ncbi:hypothetical protein [Campylobacter sp. RM9328]|uniref:hypothetical protein n=1 Tax=Campylobacter sp. RM9328 TaxID=1705720 RepID=UPI001473E8F4|nr:hypothetical protein [Campylobacter sp. RM9328]